MLQKVLDRVYICFPTLVAVYPIIFLYSYNVQQVSINQVFFPVVLALALTMVVWLLIFIFIRDRLKAGLITAIFVGIFFSYGHVYEVMDVGIIGHRHLLPLIFFFWGYLSYFIYQLKNRNTLETISKGIFGMIFLLILFNIVNIIPYEITKQNIESAELSSSETGINGTSKPDIYYIILDEYASSNTIKNIYQYNNGAFEKFLQEKGFYVTHESKTKYASTHVCIASSLNMEQINYNGTKNDDLEIFQKITNNKVKNYLANKGYKHIYIGNWAELTRWKVTADYYYNYYLNQNTIILDEFSTILVNTTILQPFMFLAKKENYNDANPVRNSVLYAFDTLAQVPKIDGPKFVFAHILCPHAPFVFGPNGEEVDMENQYNWMNKQYYLNQYIFVTKKVEQTINQILSSSKEPPIIIVQSDHGPRASDDGPQVLKDGFMIPANEQKRIFNAYYLPGIDSSVLYDNISSVNSFRLIFKQYFKDNTLPLWQD